MRHHLAIMRKDWGLLEKISNGEKTVESRWYESKRSPWGRISKGDVVWFKNGGEKVCLKAEVEEIEEYENLNPNKIDSLLEKYGEADGIGDKIEIYRERFKKKKYAIFIHLTKVTETEPFEIDKTGFGAMSAWLTVNNINEIKKC